MGRVLITLALVALSACGGSSVSVNTDFDPIASPKAATYRTWNWLRAPAGTPPLLCQGGPVRRDHR